MSAADKLQTVHPEHLADYQAFLKLAEKGKAQECLKLVEEKPHIIDPYLLSGDKDEPKNILEVLRAIQFDKSVNLSPLIYGIDRKYGDVVSFYGYSVTEAYAEEYYDHVDGWLSGKWPYLYKYVYDRTPEATHPGLPN